MEEVWKNISYSSRYEVSNLSNIRHIEKKKNITVNYERLKKTNSRARIYLPTKDNKKKNYYLHRIVAQHFIENTNDLPEVNHKNGDFYDNRACNLEWISKIDNMRHAVDNNLILNKFKRRIRVFNKISNQEQFFDSITECAKFLNCGPGTISKICNNKKIKGSRSLKSVLQCDLKGNILNKFNSYHDAAEQLKISKSAIYSCCSYHKHNDNNRPKCYKVKCLKDFIFKFDEDQGKFQDLEISYADIQQNDYNYKENEIENILWKPYPELDKYLVSNTGEVKHERTNRILKGSKVSGYRFVNIHRDDGTRKNCLIHRLVAQTFLENPEKKPVVNHKDTNILNNHVSNLEWVTYKENMNTKETINNLKKGKNSKNILQINIETGDIVCKFYGATEGSQILNINPGLILSICKYYHVNKKCGVGKSMYNNKTYKKTHIFIFEEDEEKLPEILNIAKIDNGHGHSGPKRRIVTVQIDKTTNQIINTFESGYDASKKLKFKYSGINQCCNYYKYNDEDRPKCYKLKTYNGFIFKQIVE
uniref:HNH nuclease domain-containing protein n=1 Tax=viral metagenome TaxID=1070528 RepID=A0A6C0EYW4_9ZZZZ